MKVTNDKVMISIKDILKSNKLIGKVNGNWFILVREFDMNYIAIRLDNSTVVMATDISIRTLQAWFNFFDEMHAFNSVPQMLEYILNN